MLAFIRYLLFAAAFVIVNTIILIVCIARPFHRNNVHFAGQAYSKLAWIVGVRIKIHTDSAIKSNVSYVYIANHQNSYDLITICKAVRPGVITIGKKSLKWIPLFGQIFVLCGNIMIDRRNSNRAQQSLLKAAEQIKQRALSVWVFPEGTRSFEKGLLPFKTGAFRLALDTKEAVVMVCMSNTHGRIKLNRWNNGTVVIKLYAPQRISNSKTPRQWADYFHAQMNGKIAALNNNQSVKKRE